MLSHKNKEIVAMAISVIFVVAVFSAAFYSVSVPKEKVWVGKIFDSIKTDRWTYVVSYGTGVIYLKGSHDLEIGANYRITYIQSQDTYYVAEKVISIEKL